MTEKNFARIRALRFAVVTAIVVAFAFLLCGCSLFRYIFDDDDGYELNFTRGSLMLQVGDKYDLARIIECETAAYTVRSSDTSVVSVSGTTVTSKSAGTATVKASTSYDSDTIRITVTAKQTDSLSVETDGALIQTMGSLSEIIFVPVVTGSISSSTVSWYVDGRLEALNDAGEPFNYTPTGAGEFAIPAKSDSLSAQTVVRV